MVLGICGSGREEGQTGKIVRSILEYSGKETKFISLGEWNIGGCTGCL